MKLFVLSLIAAVVSGAFARRFEKNRVLHGMTFIISVAVGLISGIRLIPESVWLGFMPYLCGSLLVLGFWTIRTQVRAALMK